MSRVVALRPPSPRYQTHAHQLMALAKGWNTFATDDAKVKRAAEIYLSDLDDEEWNPVVAASRILAQALIGYIAAGPSMRRYWGHACDVLVKVVEAELERDGG